MSKADKRVARERKKKETSKEKEFENIKADIEEARSTVTSSIKANLSVIKNGIDAVEADRSSENNSVLYDMLKRKETILTKMLEGVGEINVSIEKSIGSFMDEDSLECVVEIGENIGNYNMLLNENVNVMEEVFDLIGGKDD